MCLPVHSRGHFPAGTSLPPSIPRSTRQPAHLHPEFRICRIAAKKACLETPALFVNPIPRLPLRLSLQSTKPSSASSPTAWTPFPWRPSDGTTATPRMQADTLFLRATGRRGVYDSGGLYRERITTACSEDPFVSLPLTAHCGNWEGGLTHEELFHVCPAGEGNGGVEASTLDSRNLLFPKDSFLDLLISSIHCEHVQEAFERLLHELSIFL